MSAIRDTMSQRRPAERLIAEPEPIPRIGRSERTRAEIAIDGQSVSQPVAATNALLEVVI